MTELETLTKAFSEIGVHYVIGEDGGARFVFLCSEQDAKAFQGEPARAYQAFKSGDFFEFGPAGDLWSYS